MRRIASRKVPVLTGILLVLALIAGLWAADRANPYVERRDRVRAKILNRALLFSGSVDEGIDKNFFYLTGLEESGLALVLAPPGDGRDLLFVPNPLDANDNARLIGTSGIGRILPLNALIILLKSYPAHNADLYIPSIVRVDDLRSVFYRNVFRRIPHLVPMNLTPALSEFRMIKSAEEIALIQEAVDITAIGLEAAMVQACPGLFESDLQATIETAFQALGAARTSFSSIIGSGPNSLILHWSENSRLIQPGDLVLMDVGAEFGGYAGDLTRTVPASGFFTTRQRQVYNLVLEALNRAVKACRPGLTLSELDAVARNYFIAQGVGNYFIHSLSHSLGLEVHDAWLSNTRLVPGMVITIEPGLYINGENIGIRIEDDILITESGCIVLSAGLPRTPEEIERIFARRTLRTRGQLR